MHARATAWPLGRRKVARSTTRRAWLRESKSAILTLGSGNEHQSLPLPGRQSFSPKIFASRLISGELCLLALPFHRQYHGAEPQPDSTLAGLTAGMGVDGRAPLSPRSQVRFREWSFSQEHITDVYVLKYSKFTFSRYLATRRASRPPNGHQTPYGVEAGCRPDPCPCVPRPLAQQVNKNGPLPNRPRQNQTE